MQSNIIHHTHLSVNAEVGSVMALMHMGKEAADILRMDISLISHSICQSLGHHNLALC